MAFQFRELHASAISKTSRTACGERPAEDFVRWLYRERPLTATELAGRLRALDALAAGKLRPVVQEVRK